MAAADARLWLVWEEARPEGARPASRPVSVLEVVLGNGRVLRVLPGADPDEVAGLVMALER